MACSLSFLPNKLPNSLPNKRDYLMQYVINRNGRYYYNRRVPSEFREFDTRKFVTIALKTDSPKDAAKQAAFQNDLVEKYWNGLACSGQTHALTAYDKVIARAKTLGFNYIPIDELAAGPLEEIYNRLLHVKQSQFNKHHVDAAMGTVPAPAMTLDNALLRYFDYTKDKIISKSPNQIRKWEYPRKRAVRNFIRCNGNKDITKITREDTLRFRDWWLKRIEKEELNPATANKNIIHVKAIMQVVSDNLNLNLDIRHLFQKLVLENEENQRPPFSTEHIVSVLLNPAKRHGLNEEAWWALNAFAETGAGPSELVGLKPEDIVLNHDIPHIRIVPRAKKKLKTKFRERSIPLVGYALDAFKACPNGFPRYKDKPDTLSNDLSRHLKDNKLLPSDKHTTYSLRHSFQDRLVVVNAPDRVQADLMGHKFSRTAYGEGSTLEKKMEWIEKIKLGE